MSIDAALGTELEELLAPLVASDLGVGAPEGPEQLSKLQDALASADDPLQGFVWLSERITTLAPTAGSWVAVYLGGLVERGRLPAEATSAGVVSFFATAIADLHDDPDHSEWRECAGLLGPAVITHLSADTNALATMRDDLDLVDQIGELASVYEPCLYVDGLIRQQSGQIVVLDAPAKRALLLSYGNLGTVGHLITMVQSILPSAWSEGRTQAPEMLAIAWGENAHGDALPGDEAWFDYRDADPSSTINSLPTVGERQVLRADTSVIGDLAWGPEAFAPQLSLTPPRISLDRELSHSEVLTLLGQLH